jgi:mannose-1-phosphate guanylyltransferase
MKFMMMEEKTRESSYGFHRCGIVLAAGDGRRLRSLVQRLRGNALPKQFVNLYGTRSMLEQTFYRVEKLIPPEYLYTIINKSHLRYLDVQRQIARRGEKTIIVQPENKDTGPGLFLPLIYLSKRHPASVVAVFPSDHFIVEEDSFMDYVARAFRYVERNPSRLVLLGIKPREPESEYGYILPGPPVEDNRSEEIRTVLKFIEKPGSHAAHTLIQRGGLWNSLVMVFRLKTMLDLMALCVPDVFLAYKRIGEAVDTPAEYDVVESVYTQMTPMNFSKEVLENLARRYQSHLAVLNIDGVSWSDWGSEHRVLNDLRRLGCLSDLEQIGPPNHPVVRTA